MIIISSFSILLAEATPTIVQTAFDKIAADSVHAYSYKKITQSPEETKIIFHDASKEGDDQWQLISINDQPPTKEELKDFYKQMANTSKEGKKSFSLDSNDMYDFMKISESNGLTTFQCKLNDEKNKKMMDKVICHISVNHSDSTLQSIKMKLTEPVSPMISVKLDEFSIEMNFQKMLDTGATLLQETKTNIKGKVMVFKDLNQQVTERYYDYKLVK